MRSILDGVAPESVIDKSSPVPLHHQLELFLRRAIESGAIAPNETLPTELELQEHFQLSRTPIRQALAKLAAEGLIDRRRSQGTVVLPRPFEEDLRSLTTFTEEVRSKGLRPGSRLLDFRSQPADDEDCALLELDEQAAVFAVRRLRFINDDPVGILTAHLPAALVPRLTPDDFAETGPYQSIYYILEQVHGIRPVRASETFRAVALDAEAARLLRMPVHSAVLMRSRVTYDSGGRAVALEHGLYRGVYRLEWNGRKVSAIDTSSLPEEIPPVVRQSE